MSDKVIEFPGGRDFKMRQVQHYLEQKVVQNCEPDLAQEILPEIKRVIQDYWVAPDFRWTAQFPQFPSLPCEVLDAFAQQATAMIRVYEARWATRHLQLTSEYVALLVRLHDLEKQLTRGHGSG